MIELLLTAMILVESGGNLEAVGDGGRSIGPLQIQYVYWKDSRMPGQYQQCRDPHYARQVVRAYWKRYCPQALERQDLETLARIHNGGPQGHKKAATRQYWQRIQKTILVLQMKERKTMTRMRLERDIREVMTNNPGPDKVAHVTDLVLEKIRLAERNLLIEINKTLQDRKVKLRFTDEKGQIIH